MRHQARISSDAGFERDVTSNYFNESNSESEDSDKDEDDEPILNKMRRLNKAQQREEQILEELRQRKCEEELIQIDTDPTNPDHFDRLLSSNHNSSFIWIKYMLLHVEARDLEKARATAKKALFTIDTCEEEEKLNVWTALLTLEELYGTKESFEQSMNEAIRSHDEYQIYIKLLEMFVESNRLKALDELVARINRKFSVSIDVYLHCATVYFKLNKPDKARFILQKALLNLPTKSHVTMISEFALMENSNGSPEEAQTLFEHVVTCYPTCIDVWSLYIDMLIKSKRIDLARLALEKAAIQQTKPKNMISLFNKMMIVEEKFGTIKSVLDVQKCLNNYVNSHSKKKS